MDVIKPVNQGVVGDQVDRPAAGAGAVPGAAPHLAPAGARLWIGSWWVDTAADELGHDGETVRIEPKAMAVLMVLAGRAGAVVSRDELLSVGWPGVVVGDEALTQTIIKLRRALGDNPRAPTYIETISKRGYRLIAPVRNDQPVPPDPGKNGAAAPFAPKERAPRRLLWSGLAAVVALIAVLVWRLDTKPVTVDATLAAEPWESAVPKPLTIAVLPFESVGDGEHAYLARGIGNDLVTNLSRLPGLRLIRASTSAGTGPKVRGARYVVGGNVQRDGAMLRINIHVVDTLSGQPLWAERFERPFGDLFEIQDEIVRNVAEVLPGKLSDAARVELAKRYTPSLAAYDLFLRAQALFLVRQTEVNEEARDLYRKALALDPQFARAYAGLAMTYAMEYRLRPGDHGASLTRAFELAETARQIDPDLPEVYWALGFVHVQSRRPDQAIRSLQRALELNPSFADGYALMGGIHNYVGESAKAIPMLRTALRLNPDGGYLYHLILGRAYLYENDVEQALINLREAAARNPVDLETRIHLAAALAAAGDRAAAQWEAAEVRSIATNFSLQEWLAAYPMSSTRYRERLAGLLAEAGLH
jgi:DNA-binding winged helix-turn-helix (wHTH) protein/TolB-like protein/Flp pilus assembly protein TadD